MIIAINYFEFIDLIKEQFLELPMRWDGKDFYKALSILFKKYKDLLSRYLSKNDVKKVNEICKILLACIEEYHNGFPDRAFKNITDVMKKLNAYPLKIYRKSGSTDILDNEDPLKLYRVRNIQQNIIYERENIFHTPYNLRSKVSTCRYSISGYPSLYLGTSLQLL